MPNIVLHKADTRGNANHGWLQSKHSFSFANYYNPDRMNFGVLRVLNDDIVAPGMGFGMHHHDNMEIISIPLEGDLEHKDSMGTIAVIKHGDVQVMSAGSGISHSEYNKNKDKPVKFLQIWIIPSERNVAPRYDQITLNPDDRINKFQTIVCPKGGAGGVWIHQNAWLSLGKFDQELLATYTLKRKDNGVYVFVLSGKFTIDDIELNERDGLGISNADLITFKADSRDSEILLLEVPML